MSDTTPSGNFHRADGGDRLRLCQQQYGAGWRDSRPDQSGARRAQPRVRQLRRGSDRAAKPAISVKKSITPEFIVCLEDGKKFKSLKRHLRTQYNMTPEQYREKWGLSADYPMVAPELCRRALAIGQADGPRASNAAAARSSSTRAAHPRRINS